MDVLIQKIADAGLDARKKELYLSLCSSLLDNLKMFDAMLNGYPVICNGINYGCISAVVLRNRACTAKKLPSPITEVELMSKSRCLVIASPREVKVIEVNT